MIGRTLSHYKVLEKIGEGGMGEVYLARDTKLDREVAVKVLPATFSENRERLARFEREARLLASLNHPNIAAIHELEESDGVHFLALEYVPGETLAERIKRGPIPIDEALPLFKQIAEGLEAAHEKGVIHRDLKPANIKVTPEGKVKVLDFGLAKAMAGETTSQGLSESPTITRDDTETGVLLGTAPYMSPEQARGKAVDKRTDIWAFGCCLYEALTGKAAFLGETVTDTIAKIVEREPVWEMMPHITPAIVRSLLRRCLRKDVQGRLHDIADARIEIEEAMTEPPLSAGATPVSEARRWRAVVPWLIVALASGLAIWLSIQRTEPGSGAPMRFALDIPYLLSGAKTSSIAIAPNGTRMVYPAQQDGKTQLYLQEIGELKARPIEGTENGEFPFFSPDSQWLGFHADGKLKKISLTGGPPLPLCNAPESMKGASWGSDDTVLFHTFAETSGMGIWRISSIGGTPEPLISPRLEEGEWDIAYPELLPGGKEAVFSTLDGSCSTLRVEVMSLETGERKTLIEGGSHTRYALSGHLLYAEAGSILAVPFDLERLELTGAPVPVVEEVAITRCGDAHFSLSRNGTLIYVPSGAQQWIGRTLVWVDRNGSAQPMTDLQQRYFQGPKLSPEGDRIAMWIAGGDSQVWVYEMERGILTPLTSEGQNFWPVWSPDGKRLAFPSMRSGGAVNLFWKAADGSGSAERLTTSEYAQQPFGWSPDSKNLVFHQSLDPESGWDIWVLPMEGERNPEPFLKTPSNEFQPALSPNGRWLAYVSNESGSDEIYVTPFPGPGGKWRISTDGGREPAWNPKGGELFYRDDERMMAVDIVTQPELLPGRPRVLFEGTYDIAPPYGRGYDISRDGQRFVLTMPSESDAAPTQLHIVLNWFEELKRLVPTN